MPCIPQLLLLGSIATSQGAPWKKALLSSLELQGCDRLFIDGGSNDGDSVRSFLSGGFFKCALNGPHRLYGSTWPNRSSRERRADMFALSEPASFCIRSFEANPRLVPLLRSTKAELGSKAKSLSFVDGSLGNLTQASSTREIITYSPNRWGSTATTFDFDDIHAGKPVRLSSEMVRGGGCGDICGGAGRAGVVALSNAVCKRGHLMVRR